MEKLTEEEMSFGRRLVDRVEKASKEWEATRDAPMESCRCGRRQLKASWASMTDGDTWRNHARDRCKDRSRPVQQPWVAYGGPTDEEWALVEAARAADPLVVT